jgi:hypothetical protein
VGVMLYELLTGRRPFTGDSHAALIAAILTTAPPPPSEVVESVPADAERIIMKAMRWDAKERYASAREMLADIEALVDVVTGSGALGELASSVMQTTHAAGDLGEIESLEASGPVAPEMLARMVEESTPRTRSPVGPEARRPWRFWAALGIVAIAAVAASVVAFLGRDAEIVPTTPAGPPPAATSVTITVKGAPAGARIYFDGAVVRENPFRARRGMGVVPLRVEAAGFAPYAVSVEPSADQAIPVALVPRADEGTAAAREPEPVAPPAAPVRATEPRKKILKATRGAEFAESFE